MTHTDKTMRQWTDKSLVAEFLRMMSVEDASLNSIGLMEDYCRQYAAQALPVPSVSLDFSHEGFPPAATLTIGNMVLWHWMGDEAVNLKEAVAYQQSKMLTKE